MIIEHDGKLLDLENVTSHKQIIEYIENLPPVDTINMSEEHVPPLDRNIYEDFDFLSPKEKAIINLLLAMIRKKMKLEDKIFPKEEAIERALAKFTKSVNFVASAVDPDLYREYNRITLVYDVVDAYLQFNLYNRLGFELYINYEPNGKICTIKDLRNIP